MKTGFAEHFLASFFILVPAFFLLPRTDALVWASLCFLLGSFTPDVDHPKSIPRKAARISVFMVLLFALSYALLSISKCAEVPCALLIISLALTASLILTHVLGAAIPRHRGKVHSAKAAILFGLSLFVIMGFVLPRAEALVVGAASAAGYALHLLVDRLGDRL